MKKTESQVLEVKFTIIDGTSIEELQTILNKHLNVVDLEIIENSLLDYLNKQEKIKMGLAKERRELQKKGE
jgi:hypothetical protein